MRLYSNCPRIHADGGCLVATTSWRVRMLSFGAYLRKVIVNRDQRAIAIWSRYLWGFRRYRLIPFSDVQSVTYGFDDWTYEPPVGYADHVSEWFTVGLRLKNDSEVTLFHFIGEGTLRSGNVLPDWMNEFDVPLIGNQEFESRAYVDALAKLIGVKVTPPRG